MYAPLVLAVHAMHFRRSCSTLHQYILCSTQLLTIREVPNLAPMWSHCCLRQWLLRLSLSTLRLLQECTQHQHSVVEHVAPQKVVSHPKRENFIQNQFHPKTTFIQKPISSQNDFDVRITANKTTGWRQKQYSPCLCLGASPPAMLHIKVC